MKTNAISTIMMVLSLGAFSAVDTIAQTKKTQSPPASQGKKEMPPDHMAMAAANEPHHLLAMAYHQNMAAFTKALHDQTASANSVNVVFARSAVAEMRRSFDQMKEHGQAHMQTMTTEMHTRMSGMMKQMETHHAELNTQLTALEQELKSGTPDAKKVTTLAASVQTHLTAMSKMEASQSSKMKMKS